MEIMETNLKEVKIVIPKIFDDMRGIFYESFNQKVFNNLIGRELTFVQDNHSISKNGVLRGLHFQKPPSAQGKLIRVTKGKIFDVAVDIRKHSPSFGNWVGVLLSSKNKKMLWIPEGFAHGFVALNELTEVNYKTTDYYNPRTEETIRWDDPFLNISWPLKIKPSLSQKDKNAPSLLDYMKINKEQLF